MAPITQACAKCGKQFLVIDPEQQFLREMELPLPTNCPQCRQDRRLALRGGRKLFRTKCQVCGKDIVVAYDPEKATSTIMCRDDFEKFTSEKDYITTDPLPDDGSGTTPAVPPTTVSPSVVNPSSAGQTPQIPVEQTPDPGMPNSPSAAEPSSAGQAAEPNTAGQPFQAGQVAQVPQDSNNPTQ